MKKVSKVLLAAILTAFIAVPQNIFAQQADDEDDYDGDFYEEVEERLTPNGAGDQYIALKLLPLFPLNFDGQLYIGGGLSLGYHRFLNQYLSVGADVMFGYNTTIGSNIFTIIPITIGVTFQPYVGRFEFPITVDVGFAVENYLQFNYFPGFVLKGSAGAYYRMNETWSFGLEGQFIWLPQWYQKAGYNFDQYLGISANIGARYHF